MELELIEEFIREEFPNATVEGRQELVNTAWLFLAESEVSDMAEFTKELRGRLKQYLVADLKQINWREITIGDWRERVPGNSERSDGSDDEALSAIDRFQNDLTEIRMELEKAASEFESRKEELRTNLPPVLFEALRRAIDSEATVNWTAGFEGQSLRIFCWRALVRLRWIHL